MIQQLLQRTLRGRQASILALLAVLLLASAPALEASHDHDAGASYADCLVCKQATDLTVAPDQGAMATTSHEAITPVASLSAAVSRFPADYSPRGPPVIS